MVLVVIPGGLALGSAAITYWQAVQNLPVPGEAAANGAAPTQFFDSTGSSLVYTLSLGVYCTSWTFYGAVGTAARRGVEFITIYTGPTIVFLGWWFLLRKITRISNSQRITSIADFIASRYGKSALLGMLVTVIAMVGAMPYIALQLKARREGIPTPVHDLAPVHHTR